MLARGRANLPPLDESASEENRPAAPRPLPWFKLSLAPNGEVEVDTSTPVDPGTYLTV